MIIDIPTVKTPQAVQFALAPVTPVAENDFNPGIQVDDGDELWRGELRYANTNYLQTRVFVNFLTKLRGPANPFWFADPRHQQLGSWAGTPQVKGANQDGTLLVVDGVAASQVIGEEGDRFQLGEHLYQLTSQAVSNATNEVALEFLPSLRVIPADNTPLNVVTPRCKCILNPNQDIPQLTSRRQLLTSFSFAFREDVR